MYKVIYVDRGWVISILPPRCVGVVVDSLPRHAGYRSPIGADLGDLREESLVKKKQKQNIYLKFVWFTIYNLYLQSLMGTGKLSLVCHIKRIYGAMLWVTPKNRGPVSKQMWHNDNFIVFKRHKLQAEDFTCNDCVSIYNDRVLSYKT